MDVVVSSKITIRLDESEQFEWRTWTYRPTDTSYNFKVRTVRTSLPVGSSVTVKGPGISKKDGSLLSIQREAPMSLNDLPEAVKNLVVNASEQAAALGRMFNTK